MLRLLFLVLHPTSYPDDVKTICKAAFLVFPALALALRAETNSVPSAAAATNSTPSIFAEVGGRRFNITSNRVDYTEFLNSTNVQKLVKKHPADEIAFDLNGEKMTWGAVERYVDMQMKGHRLNIPAGCTEEMLADAVFSTRMKIAERVINGYLKNALAAQLARKAGLSLSAEETEKRLAETIARLPEVKRKEAAPELADPDSFFRRDFENFHLTLKYRDEVLKSKIAITPADVAMVIAKRDAEIAAAVDGNATLRPRLEKILGELRAGKRDFAETAAECSDDDGSACDEGVMGDYERDGTLLSVLEDYAFTAPVGKLSDVIETPYSYHILKVIARNFDSEDEDAKPGEPVSVTLAQIMFEKTEVPEKLDEKSAAKTLMDRRLAEALVKAQREALDASKLECSVSVTLLKKVKKNRKRSSK